MDDLAPDLLPLEPGSPLSPKLQQTASHLQAALLASPGLGLTDHDPQALPGTPAQGSPPIGIPHQPALVSMSLLPWSETALYTCFHFCLMFLLS